MKRGADRIVSIYWFAILFIVAAAIVYMAGLFYGTPYDVRQIEQRILENRISDCLVKGGYLREDVFSSEFSNNFLEKCFLNFNTEDVYGWNESGQYYIEIEIFEFNWQNVESPERVFNLVEGNQNLKILRETLAENTEDYDAENLSRSFYALDREENSYLVEVIALIGKNEKNVA